MKGSFMLKKVLAATLCVLLVLCGVSCAQKDPDPQIVIQVGETVFTRQQVLMSIASYCGSYNISLDDIRGDPQIWDRMKTDFTNQLAIECLAYQKAHELGIVLTNEEMAAFEKEYGIFLERLDENNRSDALSDEQLKDKNFETARQQLRDRYFTALGYTAESHKLQQLRKFVTAKVKEKVTANVTVTEEEIKNYYDINATTQEKSSQAVGANTENPFASSTVLYYPNGYKYVKNILLPFPPSVVLSAIKLYSDNDPALDAMLERERSLMQPTIDAIRARLAAGESFDALVAEYPGDEGMLQEPQKSKGYFTSTQYNELIDSYRDAVDALNEEGDVTECVTYRGYYFCYASEVHGPGPAPFEEVKAPIEQILLTNNKAIAWDQLTRGWIEEGVADGSVVINTSLLD